MPLVDEIQCIEVQMVEERGYVLKTRFEKFHFRLQKLITHVFSGLSNFSLTIPRNSRYRGYFKSINGKLFKYKKKICRRN